VKSGLDYDFSSPLLLANLANYLIIYGKSISVINATGFNNLTAVIWDIDANEWKMAPNFCGDVPKQIIAGTNTTFYVLCNGPNSSSIINEYNALFNTTDKLIEFPSTLEAIASYSIGVYTDIFAIYNNFCPLLKWDRRDNLLPYACGIYPNGKNITKVTSLHFYKIKSDDSQSYSYRIVIGGSFAINRGQSPPAYNLAQASFRLSDLEISQDPYNLTDFCGGINSNTSSIYSISGGPGPILENEYIFVSGEFDSTFESQDSSQTITIKNMAYCHVTNKQSKWYPCQDKGLSISAQSITKIVPVKGLPTIPPYDFWQKNTLLFIIIGILTLIMIVFGLCCISGLPEKEDVMFESF